MTVCWIVIGVCFLFCYLHLPTVQDEEEEEEDLDVDKRARTYSEMTEASIITVNGDKHGCVNGLINGDDSLEIPSRCKQRYNGNFKSVSTKDLHDSEKLLSSVEREDADTSRACCCCYWILSKIKRVCGKCWWIASMLVWEEVMALLYVIIIMMLCEMTAAVSDCRCYSI